MMDLSRAFIRVWMHFWRGMAAGAVALLLVFVMQMSGLSPALASGTHHQGYVVAADASNHQHAAKSSQIAIAGPAVGLSIMPDNSSSDCGGHGRHQPGSGQKTCCATACCSLALFWHLPPSAAPVGRVAPAWRFSQQFVVLDYASGLDRPPDFRA